MIFTKIYIIIEVDTLLLELKSIELDQNQT